MYPGTMFSDIDKLKQKGIQSSLLTGPAKKGFMGSGGTGSYYYPVKLMFFYAVLYLQGTTFRTGVLVFLDKYYLR
jgi:hypothetical protein